jgi:hypothetical protein
MSAGEVTEPALPAIAPPASGHEPAAGESGGGPDDRAQIEERRRDAYRVG